jgi:hypothetical protein
MWRARGGDKPGDAVPFLLAALRGRHREPRGIIRT